jgi:hypothetical protein
MIVSALALMLTTGGTVDIPWVLAPYFAVGITSFLARKNLVAMVFGFIAVVVVTCIGVVELYPYLLEHSNPPGKGMAACIVPILQWEAIGAIAAMALIGILIQKIGQRLARK